ncbi:MAG: hypothetical protein Q7S95_02750 [bacterium]|nr:hypothetical protein [bacterium]
MGRILTLTGVSGSGKTTLARMLIERVPGAAMVTSYTTRGARASDVPGEYAYISNEYYEVMAEWGEFLRPFEHVGIRFGTKRKDIDAVLGATMGIGIMMLLPTAMPALRTYLLSRGVLESHVPVFVLGPDDAGIRNRLARRGGEPRKIAQRIWDERGWESDARTSGIPYSFVCNDGPIEAAYEQVRALV